MKYLIGFILGVVVTSLFFTNYIKKIAARQSNVVIEQPAAITADEMSSFDLFYQQFHQDSAFQLSRIVFPLEGIPARDSMYVGDENEFKWQQEDWVLHRPFNDMGGTFNRSFTNLGDDLMVESIKMENGQYGMQRRFAKYDDGWYLIYYAAMNQLAVAEDQ